MTKGEPSHQTTSTMSSSQNPNREDRQSESRRLIGLWCDEDGGLPGKSDD